MSVCNVCTNFQPGFSLDIGAYTSCETAEAGRSRDDTLVIEVADRSIEIAFFSTLADRNVVFLTERCLVGFIQPVIRSEPEFLAFVCCHVTKSCIGVEFAVRADELLAFGNSKHIITQTVTGRTHHGRESIAVSLSRSVAHTVEFLSVGSIVI